MHSMRARYAVAAVPGVLMPLTATIPLPAPPRMSQPIVPCRCLLSLLNLHIARTGIIIHPGRTRVRPRKTLVLLASLELAGPLGLVIDYEQHQSGLECRRRFLLE